MEKARLKALVFWFVMLVALPWLGCSRSSTAYKANTGHTQQPSTHETKSPTIERKMFAAFFVEHNTLSYKDYEVLRLEKKVEIEDLDTEVPVTYAVLKKGGRTLVTFDGVYHSVGNATEFGVTSLIGGDSRQLVVSQTIPRGGRHWIIDLASEPAVLFDSYDYELRREEVVVMDLDRDGVSEIGLLLTAFWGFETMAMSESPLPVIVFKYDPQLRKYLPANPVFESGRENVAQDIEALSNEEKPRDGMTGSYLAKRLGILLRYVYAGKRNEGWASFDRAYNLDDKRETKARIQAVLRKEPVYRFIYGKREPRKARN